MKKYMQYLMSVCFVAISSGAFAGAVGGPKHARDTVSAKSTDTFVITFKAKEPAIISLKGDGSTDLDCFVFDNQDHLIVMDTDNTDVCFLHWRPAWTGKFRLLIRNNGDRDNEYSVATN